MSDVSEHSKFDYPEKKEKQKRGGQNYNKMLIDWVSSGQTGKYLARAHGAWTLLHSVRTPWPQAKYFPVRPSHSVNKYIHWFVTSGILVLLMSSLLSPWALLSTVLSFLYVWYEYMKFTYLNCRLKPIFSVYDFLGCKHYLGNSRREASKIQVKQSSCSVQASLKLLLFWRSQLQRTHTENLSVSHLIKN